MLYEALQYSGLVTPDMTFEEMCEVLAEYFPEAPTLEYIEGHASDFSFTASQSGTYLITGTAHSTGTFAYTTTGTVLFSEASRNKAYIILFVNLAVGETVSCSIGGDTYSKQYHIAYLGNISTVTKISATAYMNALATASIPAGAQNYIGFVSYSGSSTVQNATVTTSDAVETIIKSATNVYTYGVVRATTYTSATSITANMTSASGGTNAVGIAGVFQLTP